MSNCVVYPIATKAVIVNDRGREAHAFLNQAPAENGLSVTQY